MVVWQIYRTFANIIDNRHKKATRMKITEVLERHGTTLREVARTIGMKPSTLQTTIGGNPTIGTLRKIAEAARCPLAEFFADELAAAGLEIVKKADAPLPSEGRGMATAQGSGDEGIANADIQGSRIANPSEPGGSGCAEEQPQDGGGRQEQEAALRPAGSIICPSCGEIIKLGVLR